MPLRSRFSLDFYLSIIDHAPMFARLKRNDMGEKGRDYLQIVESFRQGGRVRQRVIATLGRLDQLQAGGALDGLLRSLGRFARQVRVVEAARSPKIIACRSRLWGPALVFGRLWKHQGLAEILKPLAAGRRFGFDPERVSFALALQRLCEPGSDLQGSQWLEAVEGPGLEGIALHQMYRTVAWLAEVRERLERELFFRDRDLFTQELDLVFLDTTSTYVYRAEETEWTKRGYSRDHRPDLPQMVLCVAVDRRGWPVAWEILPGNTADKAAFIQTVDKLRRRFRIGRVSVVADRGMISRQTIDYLTSDPQAPWDYILGARLRGQKEVSAQVLSRAGRYHDVGPNLKVKEVRVEGRRYVVCRNDEEAQKDALARVQIVARLEEKIEGGGGAKSLVGNLGFRRFLKGERGAWRIDREAVRADARFDGVFVLRTNLELPAAEIATTYKGLWRVERTFREQKSTLEVRPLYHHLDDTRIGHIVASFLALRLEVDLQRRLEEKRIELAWPNLMRDLKALQAVRMNLEGEGYLVRTDFEGEAHAAFRAAGVRPPHKVTRLPEAPPPTTEEAKCSATDEIRAPNSFDFKDA
jgi:hypothetical protein